MGRDREPKPNSEQNTTVRYGDIEPPMREIFSKKEINRLVEVRENSPEQDNNSKGKKSKMSMIPGRIRREINGILNKAFPVTPSIRIARR